MYRDDVGHILEKEVVSKINSVRDAVFLQVYRLRLSLSVQSYHIDERLWP